MACYHGDSTHIAGESEVNRPSTGDRKGGEGEREGEGEGEREWEGGGEDERPFTAVSSTHPTKPHPPQQLCGKGRPAVTVQV